MRQEQEEIMTEVLARIMNIAERIRGMDQLSQAAMAVFGIVCVFGILNCILGYRLLRFWMLLFGFGIGVTAGFAVVYTSGISDRTIYMIAMVAMGVVLAIIAFLIYRVGIFVLGAGIGLALSIYILHPTTSAVFFLCILIGVGLGLLAMRYAREVIIVGTSILGGVMGGLSLAKLGGMAEIPYGIGMSAGFAILGMLLQFAINKPEDDEDEEGDEDDGEEDEKSPEEQTDES